MDTKFKNRTTRTTLTRILLTVSENTVGRLLEIGLLWHYYRPTFESLHFGYSRKVFWV